MARVALVGWPRLTVRRREEGAQEALTGGPDQNREAQGGDALQAGEKSEVVFRLLGEAETGVDDEPLGRNTGGQGCVDAFAQLPPHVRHYVLVRRLGVHVAAVPSPVHEHPGNTCLCDDGRPWPGPPGHR